MKVSELFSLLSYGVFSNISLGGEGSGTIPAGKHTKLLGYTNLALLRLYSRFILKENDLLLRQSEHIRMYELVPKFSRTYVYPVGVTDPLDVRYIYDTEFKPFTDDVIKILMVVGEGGVSMPLNDTEQVTSLFTPTPSTIQVPMPLEGRMLGVGYQASHPVLTGLNSEILLPTTLHEAMISYIAHLTYSHMNGIEHQAKANEQLNKYEIICNEVTQMDLASTSYSQTNSRFDKKGWI